MKAIFQMTKCKVMANLHIAMELLRRDCGKKGEKKDLLNNF